MYTLRNGPCVFYVKVTEYTSDGLLKNIAPFENCNDIRMQNARVGYQAAVQLWTYEGQQVWNRFNVMMIANSIVIATVSLSLTNQRPLPIFTIALSTVGFVLCASWFLLTERGFDYHGYYLYSARELEEQFLSDSVKTVSRGGMFGSGEQIAFQIGGNPKPMKLSRWSELISARRIARLVILVFALLYVATLLQLIS